MTDQKLNLNINLGEIQNDGSNRLNEIHQCTEVFAVADRKTIDM